LYHRGVGRKPKVAMIAAHFHISHTFCRFCDGNPGRPILATHTSDEMIDGVALTG
jgi:hypothetical protein